jgi:hypothetical protein
LVENSGRFFQGSIREFNIWGQQQKDRTSGAALCGLFLPCCHYKCLNPYVTTKLLQVTVTSVCKFHNTVFISGEDGPGQLLRLYDGRQWESAKWQQYSAVARWTAFSQIKGKT